MPLKEFIKGRLREITAGVGRLLPHSDPLTPRILCYHEVDPQPADEWSVTPEQLREQLRILTKRRHPVSLSQIVDWVINGTEIPKGAVAITFDDGFLGVLKYAAPIFQEFNLTGTVFISPGLVENGTSGADPSFRARGPFMDWEQLRMLQDMGWTIGGHAMNHPVLSRLSDSKSHEQINLSRSLIKEHLGASCNMMAYPYGTPGTVSEREHNLAAKAGYKAAFIAVTGVPDIGMNQFIIPRSKVLGSDNKRVFLSILDGALDIWNLVEKTH